LYREIIILAQSGLNESYDQAHRKILLKGLAPSINQDYAIQQSIYIANVGEKPNPIVMNMNRNQGKEYY